MGDADPTRNLGWDHEARGYRRLAESYRSPYIAAGARVTHSRSGRRVQRATTVGTLPEQVDPLVVRPGDVLYLTPPDVPGGPAELDPAGSVTRPAHIGCTAPDIFVD